MVQSEVIYGEMRETKIIYIKTPAFAVSKNYDYIINFFRNDSDLYAIFCVPSMKLQ